MAREIVPSTTDGIEETEHIETAFGVGQQRRVTKDGPADTIQALHDQIEAEVLAGAAPTIAALGLRKQRGRGTLEITHEILVAQENIDDGTQELYSIEVVRGIASAPYFADLTNKQIADVLFAWDMREEADAGWSEKQKRLYGHIAHGQDQYLETAYEFRQSWTTTSSGAIVRAADGINTVQPLPRLSATLRRLVSALPAGEWLKKPTSVTSVGRGGWQVVIQYQWAPKWSVIYGGTFTGD